MRVLSWPLLTLLAGLLLAPPAPCSATEKPLGTLVDWPLPTLGTVTVGNIAVSGQYLTGDMTVAGQPWQVAVFKMAGQHKAALLLTYGGRLRPAQLIAELGGTLLNDIELDRPAFLWSAADDDGRQVTLPAPLAEKAGAAAVTLHKGLRIVAHARLLGVPAKLAAMVGFSVDGALPLVGSVDPSLFAGNLSGAGVRQTFVAGLDLNLPLPDIKPAGAPAFLQFTEPSLKLRGKSDGSAIVAGIASKIATTLPGNTRLDFIGALTLAGDGQSLDIAAEMPTSWDGALGLKWLNLRQVKLAFTRASAQQTLSIAGQTDIGRIHNLTATLELQTTGATINDIGITLTGADIPLDVLPGVNLIPEIGHFRVRDLYLNDRAFAGTFLTDLPALRGVNGVKGTIFAIDGAMNLALAKSGCALTDLLPPLPAPLLAPIKDVMVEKGALVLSAKPATVTVASLPDGARQFFAAIYGSEQSRLRLGGGVALIADIDLGPQGVVLGAVAKLEGHPVFGGEIDGIFGGVPAVKLTADLPEVVIPPTLDFVIMPKDIQSFFFISVNASQAAIGVGIVTDTQVNFQPQPVVFATQIAIQADTTGGLAIDLQGSTATAWENPLGIKGLILKPGTRIETKVAATSDVTLTLVGLTDIGSKEVKVIGSATVNIAARAIDKGAFEGSIDSISLADLVTLSNRIVAVGGGTPTKPDFPNATLKKADFAFASPGVDVPELQLAGGGIRFGGDLWLLFPDAPLGRVFIQLDGNGMIMNGDVHDIDVGPVALKNNHLDTRSTLLPPQAYCKVSGGGRLLGTAGDFDLVMDSSHMALLADLDSGDMLHFDFRAFANLPSTWLSPQALRQTDFGLASHLKSDLLAWVRSTGMKRVQANLSALDDDLKKAQSALAAAQQAVDQLDTNIAATRKQVAGEASNRQQQIDKAQSTVNHLNETIAALNKDISTAQSQIKTCNQNKNVCLLRNPLNKKCVKTATVPDLKARTSCGSVNLRSGAVIAEKTPLRDTMQAALKVANQALKDVKAGTAAFPVDMDPRVATLITERAAAAGILQIARDAVTAAARGTELVNKAIAVAQQPGALNIKDSIIQGSLQKVIAGTPAVIGIDFTAFGQDYHNGFAFSLGDWTFDADQLDLLAFFAVVQAAEADPQFPPLVLHTLQQLYSAKEDAVADKLAAALAANGLE